MSLNFPDATDTGKGKVVAMKVRKAVQDQAYDYDAVPPSTMQPMQFGKLYHGSQEEFQPGDMITPPNSRGGGMKHFPAPHVEMRLVNDNERVRTGDETYAAYSPRMAHQYSRKGNGNVYEVEHTGEIHPDPENPGDQVYSMHPLRVKRKLSPDESTEW